MILVIGPRLEGHSVIFLAIQTHLSCRFLRAVDSLGLRPSGSSSQIIDQAQDFLEQTSRHRDLGKLERHVPPVTDGLGTDLHQLFPPRAQRPFNVGYWLGAAVQQCPLGLPLSARKQTFVPQCPDSAELRQLQVRERIRRLRPVFVGF